MPGKQAGGAASAAFTKLVFSSLSSRKIMHAISISRA
jgi:hypothetical protein